MAESQLAIAYYDQDESAFDNSQGETNLVNYSTGFLFKPSEMWALGVGHRSAILNVDDLALQTNGYLHTFFVPVHRTTYSDRKRFRFSVAPVLSGSSNVVKDPSEYTRDAFQLLAALVWSRQVSDRLGLRYGVCGDNRFGGYQVYPLVSLVWQPGLDWTFELGFPASQMSYKLSGKLTSWLRFAPNGNEWHVRDKRLENRSQLVYEAFLIEWALGWRAHKHLMLTASVGRQFRSRYEMTLLEETRVRLSGDSATRVGIGLTWIL